MAGSAIRTVVAALTWLALASPALADVGAFLKEVVAAHGGGVAPTAIHERGTTQSVLRGKGPVQRWWQAPDRLRIEIDYPGMAESRLLRGAEAWQQGAPASAAFRGALLLQATRMALPWRLQENAARVVDRGTTTNSAGKPVRMLEWAVGEGMKLIVEIDPASRRILLSHAILTINNATMEFITGYENYKTVAGRLMPFTEQHFAMGQFTGTTSFEHIEFPAVLPAPTFDPAPATVMTRRDREANHL